MTRLRWPSRIRQQADDLPGAAQLLGAAVAGRAALGAASLHTACSAAETGSRRVVGVASHRLGIPLSRSYVTALAVSAWPTDEAAAALTALDKVQRRFRSLDHELSLARAWVAAGQGAVSEAIAIAAVSGGRAAEAQGDSRRKCSVSRPPPSSVIAPARPGWRELESIVEGPRVGLAARFAEALRDGDAAELVRRVRGFRAHGRSRCRRRRGRPRRARLSSPRQAGIGIGMLDTRRGSGRPMRRSPYPGASSGQRVLAV